MLHDVLTVIQIAINYSIVLSSYSTVLLFSNKLGNILNLLCGLFSNLLYEKIDFDYRLLKKFQYKILLVHGVLYIMANGLYLVTSPDYKNTQIHVLVLHFTGEILMFVPLCLFEYFIIVGSVLYRNINHRVVHTIGVLRDFDKNAAYWDEHKVQKSKVCHKLAKQLLDLCELHRKTSVALEQISLMFSLPIMLVSMYEFILITSSVIS